MAKEAKKNNKGIIVGVCGALVVAVAVIIAVVLINANTLNDSYFVSDGTKYVLTIESEELSIESDENGEYMPLKTHMVYTYKDDTITGLKTYSEYADAASAREAYNALKDEGVDMTLVELKGKYIVTTATEDQYEGVTASAVKQQLDYIEKYRNLNNENNAESENGTNSTEEGEVVEVTSNEEEGSAEVAD